jgi:hypothetical protein
MQESLCGNRRRAADGITLCKDGTAWAKYIDHPAQCDSTYSISSLCLLSLSKEVNWGLLDRAESGWIGPWMLNPSLLVSFLTASPLERAPF